MLTFSTPSMEGLGLESMPMYPIFNRQFGVIRAVQLAAPKLSNIDKLELPKLSILHYLPQDEAEIGAPQDDPIFREVTRLLMTEHIIELGDNKGNPRIKPIPARQMVREYHRQNRRTRELVKPETTMREELTVVVENYALLNHLYRYPPSYFRAYYKWWNIQAALWKRVGHLTENYPKRHQFLMCQLPQLLPTVMQLRRGEGEMTRPVMGLFPSPEALFILEIWKWLGPNRERSVLSLVPPESLAQMNLIWTDSGKWLTLNLGLLDQWRKRPQTEANSENHGGSIEATMLQKRFLRLLMALMETRVVEQSDSAPAALIAMGDERVSTDTQVAVNEPKTKTVETVKAEPVRLSVQNEDGTVSKVKLTSSINVDRLPEQESAETMQAIDEAITKDLDALDQFMAKIEPQLVDGVEDSPLETTGFDVSAMIKYVPEQRDLASSIMARVDQQADAGLCSGAMYRHLSSVSTAYQRLPDPYGGPGKLTDYMDIPAADIKISREKQIKDSPAVPDKSMLSSSLFAFDKQYLDKVIEKDIVRAVVNMQHAGVAVTSFQADEYQDALNHYVAYTVQLTPVVGKPSTVNFKLPKVQNDGTFIDNGVRYRLRKQRGDMPIRKVSPSKVILSSYYNRIGINRSEKVVNNYPLWLTNQLALRAVNEDDLSITNAMVADVADTTVRTPRIYSILSTRFRSFHCGEFKFFFDYHVRKTQFGAERVEKAETDGLIAVGTRGDNLLLIDNTNTVYESKGIELETVGPMEELLGVSDKSPIEMAEIRVFNKQIPVGIYLAYHLGLTELFKLLGVTPRRVPTGTRANMSEDEVAIRFEDELWIFPRDRGMRSMILTGLLPYEKTTRNYPAHLFDKKDIYYNVLEQSHIGLRYLREMDLMNDLFVDPITEEILKELKEPTDFIGLVLRACELLETDWSPDETDMAYMRIKGYERFPGAIYDQLVKAIRQQRARGTLANAKIDLHPRAVWMAIQHDPAVKLVEESNPVHNLREREEVTYSGTGGRSSRSMVGRTRVFHENDLGVISESTKDSAEVAIVTFTSANPNLADVRGTTTRYNPETDGPTAVISSPALLSPAADRDDPKRVNFIPIQHSSGTFAKGYRALPVRTGYERVMAHRTDEVFSAVAEQEGEVTAINERALTVTYADGTKKSVQLGRKFGKAQGLIFPHELATVFKQGDKVQKGDILAYNSRYFQPDPFVAGQVVWKGGLLVRTAIMESPDTLEDSSAISARVAEELATEVTYVRDITVRFDQAIREIVQTGDAVDVESILCMIEDAVTAQNELFDDESAGLLRLIAANTPRAKYKGKVEKVEVFYHGDVDDMSPSLQELAAASDRNRRRVARDMGQPVILGRVNESMRIQGDPLPSEHVVIRIYITGPSPAGVGDKGVFANQLKTIFGRVLSGVNETESGEPLDAIFSYMSISNRIVRSPEIIGVASINLQLISKRAVAAYRGK